MKIKTIAHRISQTFLAILLVALSFTNVILLFSPPTASAAGAPTDAVSLKIDKNGNTANCTATISGPQDGLPPFQTVVRDNSYYTKLKGLAQGSAAYPNDPSDAQDVFKKLSNANNADRDTVLTITFGGAGGATNSDAACAKSMVLFRASGASNQKQFYGVWFDYINTHDDSGGFISPVPIISIVKVVSGTVDPAKRTLSFGLPDNTTALINLKDPNKILSNGQYFGSTTTPGGGGATTTQSLADCLAKHGINPVVATAQCLAKRQAAAFTDIAHIEFDGETYTAGQWGGGGIAYTLEPGGGTDPALKALAPSFNVNTAEGADTDIAITGSGPLADNGNDFLTNIHDNLGRVLTLGPRIDTENVIYYINGKKIGDVATATAGMNVVANYYPDSKTPANDVIALPFSTHPAANESNFFGKYTKTTDTTFTLPNSSFSGCGPAMQPRFELSTAPTKAEENGTTIKDATWWLVAATQPCKQIDIRVRVVIQKPDTPEPQVKDPAGPAGTENPTCENAPDAFLAWMFCPVINGLIAAVNGIYANIVQPMLVVSPIATSRSPANCDPSTNKSCDPTHVYAIWQNFRILGNIFLIIALLVIVFGQSLGGGLIDAYSARKILPRLLVAAVAINLSIYIIAFAVDVTNVVGGGIASLIQQPFAGADAFKLKLGNRGAALGALLTVSGVIWLAFGATIELILLFVLIPTFFVFIAILATVIVRQALIILLVLTAPVAFALYTLPNTEQYFRKWWDLLFRTLLVYPIIAVVFALGNIMSVVISSVGSTANVSKPIADLLSFIALVLPLVLIPYSFRLAGGLLGKLHDVVTNYGKRAHEGIKGNPNDPWSWRNQAKRGYQDRSTQNRERFVEWGAKKGVTGRTLSRLANYGNLQARRARFNKEGMEIMDQQIATGADSNIRDMFIKWHDGSGGQGAGWYRRMDFKEGEDGVSRPTMGASQIYKDYTQGNIAHKKAMSLFGGNKSLVQKGLHYEWKKTGFDEKQLGNLEHQYSEILDEHGFNNNEGAEIATGVGYGHAAQSLGSKHTKWTELTDEAGNKTGNWGFKTNYAELAKEGALTTGTYQWSNQDRKTILALEAGFNEAHVALGKDKDTDYSGDQTIITSGAYAGKTKAQVYETRERIARIANNINPNQSPSGQPSIIPGEGGGDPSQQGPMAYGGISSAPVDVQEAAKQLVRTVSAVKPNGSSAPGGQGGGPTIITPGSPGFNIPPGSRPNG